MLINTRRISTVIAGAALVLSSACGHDEPTTADLDLEPIKARTAEAELITDAKPILVRGIVQPTRQSFVSSRAMGPVVAVRVAAGDVVRRGQALVEIQPETSAGQVAQAQGALAQATAALTMAERNLQRFKALYAEKAASEVELDMARMQFEQSKGAVEQAEGAVRAASSVADEAVVRAPFAARVVDKLVEVGDMAAPGRPLVRLESFGGSSIWLTLREADIRRVTIGQNLPVAIDSRSESDTLNGTVSEIVPFADPATHTFTVKVDLGDAALESGLAGRAWLPGDVREMVAVVDSAVHTRGGLELVVVRADDGTARTRAVTTGAALGDGRIEILSGIRAGETVVVDGPGPVADGTPVEVIS